MSKPEDIPQDVWEVAIDAADDWFEVGDKFYRACAIHFAKIILAAKAEERRVFLEMIENGGSARLITHARAYVRKMEG